MNLRSITMAVVAAAVLAGGALTAVAANHGSALSNLATTTVSGEAKGDAISSMANAKSAAAKTDADETATPGFSASPEASASPAVDSDAHGDAVSAVAKSDATATCTHGTKTVTNHGCAVSTVAKTH